MVTVENIVTVKNNMNVKQRYRLTRRLATANNLIIRNGITNFCLPHQASLPVSGSMMDPIESYLFTLWSPCNIWLLLYVIPCWRTARPISHDWTEECLSVTQRNAPTWSTKHASRLAFPASTAARFCAQWVTVWAHTLSPKMVLQIQTQRTTTKSATTATATSLCQLSVNRSRKTVKICLFPDICSFEVKRCGRCERSQTARACGPVAPRLSTSLRVVESVRDP